MKKVCHDKVEKTSHSWLIVWEDGHIYVWERGSIYPQYKEKVITWGWWNTGTGCPERWWIPLPWKHLRSDWTGSWVTSSSWRGPYSLQGNWADLSKILSNPNYSILLCVYKYICIYVHTWIHRHLWAVGTHRHFSICTEHLLKDLNYF